MYALCSSPFLLEKCGGNLELQQARSSKEEEIQILSFFSEVGHWALTARQLQSAANIAFASWTLTTVITISNCLTVGFFEQHRQR